MSIIPAPRPERPGGRRRRIRSRRVAPPASRQHGTGPDDLMAVAEACGVARPIRTTASDDAPTGSGVPGDAAGLLARAAGDLLTVMRILGEPEATVDSVVAAGADPSQGRALIKQIAQQIDVQLRARRDQLDERDASPLTLALREADAALRWVQLYLDAAEALLATSPRS